jgi:hypothetical protein
MTFHSKNLFDMQIRFQKAVVGSFFVMADEMQPDISDLHGEMIERYIILDKRSWFNGISKSYQKWSIAKGILINPENATRSCPERKGFFAFKKNNMWRRLEK